MDMTPVATPHVLIVDRETDSREFTRATLARAEYRCVAVADRHAALQAARDEPIDIALVTAGPQHDDDGMWVARRLRRLRGDIAVVLLARTHDLETAVEALRVGALDYRLRPRTDWEVVDIVERARHQLIAPVSEAPSLEDAIADRVARLRQAFAETAANHASALDVLLARLYASRPATLAHLRRVSSYSEGVAALMGLDHESQRQIAQAALVHDVGRLAVPASILDTPQPLTRRERIALRRRSTLAMDVVRDAAVCDAVRAIVGSVLERFDGSGRPRGLRADQIPIGSRIIAVTKTFDTLTLACTLDDEDAAASANAAIVRAAGRNFDPAIVCAWLHYVDAALIGRSMGVTS